MRLSQKERNRRWEEYQKKLEDKDKDRSKATCAPQANTLGDSGERFAVPSMPVEHCDYEPRRSDMRALVEDKLSEIQKKLDFDLFANVAKVLTKHEISKSPGAHGFGRGMGETSQQENLGPVQSQRVPCYRG